MYSGNAPLQWQGNPESQFARDLLPEAVSGAAAAVSRQDSIRNAQEAFDQE